MKNEKIKQYEHPSTEPVLVEEPLAMYGTPALDESKRYTYADYLTWMDDKGCVGASVSIFEGLEIDLNEIFED